MAGNIPVKEPSIVQGLLILILAGVGRDLPWLMQAGIPPNTFNALPCFPNVLVGGTTGQHPREILPFLQSEGLYAGRSCSKESPHDGICFTRELGAAMSAVLIPFNDHAGSEQDRIDYWQASERRSPLLEQRSGRTDRPRKRTGRFPPFSIAVM